jgi:hypothetical protein
MAGERLKVILALLLGIFGDGRDVREARRNVPVLRETLDSTASAYCEVAGRKTSLTVDRRERSPSIGPRQQVLDRSRMLAC